MDILNNIYKNPRKPTVVLLVETRFSNIRQVVNNYLKKDRIKTLESDLRKEIEQEIINGSEISITEYIMDGRDLASYNVRFSAAVNGKSFNF